MGRGRIEKRLVVAFGVACCIVVLASGCRQVVGIDDRSAHPTCGSARFGEGTCGSCVAEQCCAELGACDADLACRTASACVASCTPADSGCRSRCLDEYVVGFGRPLADLLACEARSCASACDVSCGGIVTTSSDCVGCLSSACCESARDCGEDGACLARRFCREACTDAPCRRLCDARNVEGASKESMTAACESRSCAPACAAWSCLATPPPAESDVAVTIQVLDSVDAVAPVAGVRVRRCANEGNCTVWQTTNGSGVVRLAVERSPTGAPGYFEVEDPNGKYVRTFVFVAPSLRASAVVSAQLLSQRARDQVLFDLAGTSASGGFVLAHVVDCLHDEAAGVRFRVGGLSDSTKKEYYLRRLVPVLADRGAPATDDFAAYGGFLDVAPGSYSVQGWATIGGVETRLFDIATLVRADAVTFVDYAPAR